jgi:hypothetical protein
MLAQGQKMRVAALPHLRKFRKDADPQVRAAALAGLCTVLPSEMGDEVSAGLQDPSDKVRIAAASVCFHTMEAQRSSLIRQLQQQNEGNVTFDAVVEGSSSSGGWAEAIHRFFTKTDMPKPVAESTPVLESKAPDEVAEDKSLLESKPAAETKPPAKKKPSEPPNAADEDPYELWLKEYYTGKHRPKWAADLIGPLEKMLQSKNVDERLAAAIALVPLGKAPTVLPLAYAVAQSDPKKYREVMEVLPWLVWEQRLAVFQQMRKIAPTPEAVSALIGSMAEVHDPRATELLWKLLADPKTTEHQAGAIEEGLLSVHGIHRWYSSRSTPQSAAIKKSLLELARSAKLRAASGSDFQRQVALGLLTYADAEEAIRIAEKLQADPATAAVLRTEAFQVMLVAAPPKEAAGAAAAALSGKDSARQKLALRYFVYGPEVLSSIRDTISVSSRSEGRTIRSGVPIVPKPPEGLKVNQILPLLDDSDPAVAAEAGYLLALMGESRGLEPLLRYAQQQGKSDSQVQRLAYRAIAVLDDSNQIPLLRKIYAGLSQYEVTEFYWTIRIMTGPEILKFRKQIRDEVGMSQLQ